jgi:type IV pilus assembly protein PilW
MQAIRARRYAAGMSMVELMVAMAIALIGTIIIFQVFEVSEGIRRTTTSGGDAQQNGVIGLYVVENDLRNAGMGFNDTSYAGCNATAFDNLRAPQSFTIPI